MLTKIFVLIMVVLIFASLGTALFQLLRGEEMSERVIKALTLRVVISLLLFIILLLLFSFGVISPRGV